MTAAAVDLPRGRARLLRYARWQALDFAINIAIVSIVLFGFIGVILLMDIHSSERVFFEAGYKVMPLNMKLSGFLQMWGMFATVAPIIAVSGVVSQDRAAGYARFLFAKPLSPRLFYLQSWLVRLVGFIGVGTVLVVAYNFFEPPSFSWRFVVDMIVTFVSIGGVVFLFSVIGRFDGLVVALVLMLSFVAWTKWESATGVRHALLYALPPISHLGAPHYWLLGINQMSRLADVPFPAKWVAWNVGYGLACLLLGLYFLRKVSLTKA